MRVLATPTLDQSTSGSTCSMVVHHDCGAGRSPHTDWTKKLGAGHRGLYCMQGTTHYYAGDRYGVTGPGGCNFGQFGQYCAMEDVACYESAFFGDEAQAVAFDELMVELASIRSEPSSPEPQVSGPTSAAASGGSQSSGGNWLRKLAVSIEESLDVTTDIQGCVEGVRVFWTTDGGTKLAQASVVLVGGSIVGCGFGIAGTGPP